MSIKCQHISECPFVTRLTAISPKLPAMTIDVYCAGTPDRCAIRSVLDARSVDEVPDDLWPGDRQRAREIIQDQAH